MRLTDTQAAEYARLRREDIARRAVAEVNGDPRTVGVVAAALVMTDDGRFTGPDGVSPVQLARTITGGESAAETEAKPKPAAERPKLSEMTEREKMDYLDEHGTEAFTALVMEAR